MSKFTPGPWEFEPTENNRTGDIFTPWEKRNDGVRQRSSVARVFMSSQTNANGNLIAAAPDMYEALELVISYLGLPEDFLEGEEILYFTVTKALIKARGESHD